MLSKKHNKLINMEKKDINICIDSRALLGSGGIPQYTEHLIKNLETEGKTLYLFCNSLRKIEQYKFRFLKVFTRIPNKIFNFSLLLFGWPKINKMIERKISKKIDLYFLPNINFWRDKDAKKIVVAHDLSYVVNPKFFCFRDRVWHKIINPKRLYTEADIVIAVSHNTKKDLINFFNIPEEKIKVIYPGVNVDATELQNKKENYILYLANLEPRKNILGLIDAYERILTDIDLVIAGGGHYKKQIKKRIKQSSKKDRIKLIGYVKEGEKAKLISEAQLFVYPSFYEGFGFPPLEAQILGIPVVASLTSSMSEVLGSSAILINPYNSLEISKAIDEILINDDLRDELIKRGWDNVRRFSWKNTAKQTIEVIDELISR